MVTGKFKGHTIIKKGDLTIIRDDVEDIIIKGKVIDIKKRKKGKITYKKILNKFDILKTMQQKVYTTHIMVRTILSHLEKTLQYHIINTIIKIKNYLFKYLIRLKMNTNT